jgi:hypothetical protein
VPVGLPIPQPVLQEGRREGGNKEGFPFATPPPVLYIVTAAAVLLLLNYCCWCGLLTSSRSSDASSCEYVTKQQHSYDSALSELPGAAAPAVQMCAGACSKGLRHSRTQGLWYIKEAGLLGVSRDFLCCTCSGKHQ